MIAKMIIPTFILSGWRYLIIFDFFFFANALFLPAVSGICCARNYVPGESPHSYRHTNSRGEPAAPAVKNTNYVLQRNHYIFLCVLRHFCCIHGNA